jgi:hypothetical protein
VERRSVGDVAPSRCGIASFDDDAEMCDGLGECNEASSEGIARVISHQACRERSVREARAKT